MIHWILFMVLIHIEVKWTQMGTWFKNTPNGDVEVTYTYDMLNRIIREVK